MSIQPLPPEVIAQIKSSITITDLNTVIFELAKNSLDANCTKLDVSVDYARGGCMVEDDGVGILPSEFGENGGLGKLHHSSKFNAQNPQHGSRGTFLAALSALALVSITSHHQLHRSHNSLNMYRSQVVSRQLPALPQQYLSCFDHGTRVTVHDLFGNMPVRVKQRAISVDRQRGKDWEELKRGLVLLLLSWPTEIALTLRESDKNQKFVIKATRSQEQDSPSYFSIPRICRILSQATLIQPGEKSDWTSVNASTPHLDIRGAISLEPSPWKHVQFISFGIHPLLGSGSQSVFHDEINRLFANSAFGNEEVEEVSEAGTKRRQNDGRFKGDTFTERELKGGRKGVDRWPMFYINIQQLCSVEATLYDIEATIDDKGNQLIVILELLRRLIFEFLKQHHFRPRAGRGFGSVGTENDRNESHKSGIPSPKKREQHKLIADPPLKMTIVSPNKSSLTRARSAFDYFGINLNLSTSRHPRPATVDDCGSWSNIKSGNPLKVGNINRLRNSEENGKNIQRASTSPPLGVDASRIGLSRFVCPESVTKIHKPLVSIDGKIIRRPFEDVDIPLSRTQYNVNKFKVGKSNVVEADSDKEAPGKDASALGNNQRQDESHGEDIVMWANPFTKVEALVNRRTGLIVTASEKGSLKWPQNLRQNLTTSLLGMEKTSPWIMDLLQKWENPVFRPAESSIPQVKLEGYNATTHEILRGHHHRYSQIDIDRAFKECSAGVSGRISKHALKHAHIVSQVDKKFILVSLQSSSSIGGENTLVIIDQHAADERIRVEGLMRDLCAPPSHPQVLSGSPITTSFLEKPLTYDIPVKEADLLQLYRQHFADWGIIFDISKTNADQTVMGTDSRCLTVRSLPPAIIERCKLDPRLLIDLVRTELYVVHEKGSVNALEHAGSWLERIHSCPQGIIDLINSRACRSAIMFNDELNLEQCETLVKRLADCRFPFQCAHGRPSLVPLCDLETMSFAFGGQASERKVGFGKEFRAWKTRI